MREQGKFGIESKTVSIRRVAKVTAGGKRLRFSAMVVVGDRKGSVGVGLGRGVDTRAAVDKGTRAAEKAMVKIQVLGDTIPHEVTYKQGASKILLKPAKAGTGIIAGAAARNVLELAGIESVYAKQLGSSDLVANTYCTFLALKDLRSGRVLKKMEKMKERIDFKLKLERERKEKEMKKRAENKRERGDRKDDRRNGKFGHKGNGRPFNKKFDNKKQNDNKVNKEVDNVTQSNTTENK